MTTEESKKESENGQKDGDNQTLLIILGVALVVSLIAVVALVVALLSRGSSGSEGAEVEGTLPPPAVETVEPPDSGGGIPTRQPPIVVPTPDPGEPAATVIAPDGANVRVGPGTEYPIIGTAPQGATGEVVGVSADGQWWAVLVPESPNDTGWVLGELVSVENVGDVPVLPVPPPPPTPTNTPTPAPDVVFEASRTMINAGETSILTWSVENVQAVYLYPVGANWPNYPVSGQGSQEVQPFITTTYQLRVINRDNSTDLTNIEITVNGGLTDGRWLMRVYESSSGALVSALPGIEVTASFSTGGGVSGSGGCNTYNGGFQAYDQTLTISRLTATNTACEEDVMQQEAEFLAAMERSSKMSIIGNELSIRDRSGKTILAFTRG